MVLSGANGSSTLRTTILYTDGSEEHRDVLCPDWHDDRFLQSAAPYTVPILNDMDRLKGDKFDDANDPALFEFALSPSRPQAVVGLRLSPQDSRFDNDRTTINVFAVTGVHKQQP